MANPTIEQIEQTGRELLKNVGPQGAALFTEIGAGILEFTALKKAGDKSADRVLRSLVAQAKAAPDLLGIKGETAARRIGEVVLEWALRATRL